MRHQHTFQRHTVLTEVAMQLELKERCWQPPIRGPFSCPACQSTKIGKLMTHRDGNTHSCNDCRARFSHADIPGCTCWYPGQFEKCQQCPGYRQVRAAIKALIAGELSKMTTEAAEALLADPDFYDKQRFEDLKLQSTKQTIPSTQQQDSVRKDDAEDHEVEQLNLF